MLGMLSPSSRGALMTSGIFLFVFMGLIAGYFSARIYKTMKGREWKRGAFLTATLYPGIVFTTCFFLNFFIWDRHSSGAVPFGTMIWLLCLWFGISLPLVSDCALFFSILVLYFLFVFSRYTSDITLAIENSRINIRSEQIWFRDKFPLNNGIWI